MACPVCGFDPTSLSPADAVVALRSLPRRYREAAGLAGDDPDPGGDGNGEDDAGPGHPDGDAADRRALVLAQAAQAGSAIAALGEDLRRVLISDDPALTTTDDTATAGGGGSDGTDPDAVLARLKEVTDRVAELTEDQPATAWKRVGHRSDGPRSAAALLGEAVHAGVHHLRLAQQAVGRG
jgi:hypothetical protein